MAEDTDNDSKTEEPSAKKLSDAKAKGDTPKSQDVPQLASLLGAVCVVLMAGGWLTRDLSAALTPFWPMPARSTSAAAAPSSWPVRRLPPPCRR
jgi:flagellar biosynthesis protein FlhB